MSIMTYIISQGSNGRAKLLAKGAKVMFVHTFAGTFLPSGPELVDNSGELPHIVRQVHSMSSRRYCDISMGEVFALSSVRVLKGVHRYRQYSSFSQEMLHGVMPPAVSGYAYCVTTTMISEMGGNQKLYEANPNPTCSSQQVWRPPLYHSIHPRGNPH